MLQEGFVGEFAAADGDGVGVPGGGFGVEAVGHGGCGGHGEMRGVECCFWRICGGLSIFIGLAYGSAGCNA